jgi:hypothetical protein
MLLDVLRGADRPPDALRSEPQNSEENLAIKTESEGKDPSIPLVIGLIGTNGSGKRRRPLNWLVSLRTMASR